MYNSVNELILEFIPFFSVPIFIAIMNAILRIVKDIAQGAWIEEKGEEKETEEEKPQKINIDKDLQKYFNYKE